MRRMEDGSIVFCESKFSAFLLFFAFALIFGACIYALMPNLGENIIILLFGGGITLFLFIKFIMSFSAEPLITIHEKFIKFKGCPEFYIDDVINIVIEKRRLPSNKRPVWVAAPALRNPYAYPLSTWQKIKAKMMLDPFLLNINALSGKEIEQLKECLAAIGKYRA